MWLHSQYPEEWPESSARDSDDARSGNRRTDDGRPQVRRFEDERSGPFAATGIASEILPSSDSYSRSRYVSPSNSTIAEPVARVEAILPTLAAMDARLITQTDSHFDLDLDSHAGFDLALGTASRGDSAHARPLYDRFSDWHVKLRFRRADLYLGLAIFLAAAALLWPAAVPRRPAALAPWERALVMLGIAEAPAPLMHQQGDPNMTVWIDPHTALYYCPGEELYGKTADGHFSTQHDAQSDRFEPANRAACE
jgi:hypothetical protein